MGCIRSSRVCFPSLPDLAISTVLCRRKRVDYARFRHHVATRHWWTGQSDHHCCGLCLVCDPRHSSAPASKRRDASSWSMTIQPEHFSRAEGTDQDTHAPCYEEISTPEENRLAITRETSARLGYLDHCSLSGLVPSDDVLSHASGGSKKGSGASLSHRRHCADR